MSGLFPQNGATDQSQSPIIRIEFCGMSELWLNKFNLLNPNGSIFQSNGPDFIVALGDYWATLTPTVNLANGTTYSLEIEGRINDGGTVKAINAGTWAFTVRDIEDPGILYNEDFSGTSYTIPHTLTATECQNNFGWINTLPASGGTMHLVDDPDPIGNRGTVLKVDFAEGNYGTGVPVPGYPATPNGMRSQIWSDAGRDELYIAFDIYFPNDFVFPLTMRGPALWGGEFHETTSPADYGKRVVAEIRNHGTNLDADAINNQYVCQQTNNIDGEISLYSYDAVQSQYDQKVGTEYKKGEWNRIEYYVKINDPNTDYNGKLYAWINNQQIFVDPIKKWISTVDSGLQFETAQLLFSGNDPCWMSPKNQSLYIDNITISENPIHVIPTVPVFGVSGRDFTYSGTPTFVLSISYYGGTGASEGIIDSDLTQLAALGYNNVRVWATWNTPSISVSVVENDGSIDSIRLNRLKYLIEAAGQLGMTVDVTFGYGAITGNFNAFLSGVEDVATALIPYQNVFFDVGNEFDTSRELTVANITTLAAAVKAQDPNRLLTASAGPAVTGNGPMEDKYDALYDNTVIDFAAPHFTRSSDWHTETQGRVEDLRTDLIADGHDHPIYCQEPHRRGYQGATLPKSDFLTAIVGAEAGGAAGWCFHNDAGFNLTSQTIFDQFDSVELDTVDELADQL